MKSRTLTCITAMTLFAALDPVVAEEQQQHKKEHTQYKFVDLGTLGGPTSVVDCCDGTQPVVNNRGTVVGGADTSLPNPNVARSCPLIPPDLFINVGVAWQDGAPTNLGALPGGFNSFANSIGERGLIVGASEIGETDPVLGTVACHPALWKDDDIIDLGTFGGFEGLALESNNRGQVVGLATNRIGNSFPGPFGHGFPAFAYGTQQRAFLWQDGVLTDLGTLGGFESVAAYVNNRGQIAGASFTNSTADPAACLVFNANCPIGLPTEHPFLWEHGKTWDVGTLGGAIAFPNGLNDHGQIVGTSLMSGNSIEHPFLWTKSSGIQDLGTLGGDFGEAYAINDNEEISGVASNNKTFLAVLWRHGMVTNLGTLAGDCASSGYDINSNGQIVGASFACSSAFVSHPFVWEDGQMTRLHILVPPGSKLVSAEPSSINDRGEIAGFSVLDNGASRAWLLLPCDRDHSDSEGCEAEDNGRFADAQNSVPVPEMLSALRARMARRYHVPGLGGTKN